VDLNVDLLNECISYRVEWLTEAREDEGSTQKNKRRGGKKTWRGGGVEDGRSTVEYTSANAVYKQSRDVVGASPSQMMSDETPGPSN